MATGTFENGDYTIDDDSNNNLVIKDDTGTTILTWDSTNNKWVMSASAPLDVAELIDGGGQSHTGVLEDDNHATEHESGGGDAITIGNLVNFDPVEVLIDTAANRPAAGTTDRIFIESDTGRVLRDNGTSYDEVGLSESQISLANLASRAHDDLSDDVTGAADQNNSGSTVIQDVTMDPHGHVTGLTAANPNVPDWVEDGNSPATASAANSVSITLASSYDEVMVFATAVDQSGTDADVNMQVNGDTGANYRFVDQGGTRTTGASSFAEVAQGAANQKTVVQAVLSAHAGGIKVGSLARDDATSSLQGGSNVNVVPPVDSVTLSTGASTDWVLEAFGRNIQ